MRLRTWLKKQPQPFSVRVVVGTETRDVAVDHSDQRKWARTEETVISMGASKIEALRKDGQTLRALDLEIVKEKEEAAAAAGKPIPTDESELAQLARVINEAHDNAARRHEGAYLQGYGMLVELTKKSIDAMLDVSKSNEKLNQRLAAIEAAATTNADGGLPDIFVQGIMARMGIGPGPAAAPAGQNGQGPHVPAGLAQLASALASAAEAEQAGKTEAQTNGAKTPAKPPSKK
jgi:hypothetical protein